MIKEEEILVTGGSGLLGRELHKLISRANYPSHRNFDVNDFPQIEQYLNKCRIKILIHLAAITSPPTVDEIPLGAMYTNITGTTKIVDLCATFNTKLIYISTDYVFSGLDGNYNEYSPINPVNKYAWSKLGGECAVRMYDNSLIIRTSFGPNKFPYEKAFTDQWTSRQSVSIIARKIVRIIKEKPDLTGIIHIGGDRKTVYEYARESKPDVGRLKRADVDFKVPRDTSLDCSKYKALFEEE